VSVETGVDIGALEDFADGEARKVEVDGRPVAVVRLGGDVYAIGDTCTHANVSLSEGEVDADERTLECWKHGSAFSLETGEPTSLPATRPVGVYTVTVEDGRVLLRSGG
jgi:3-phenylpropionate/trans-cinnamate dioxygenase ferredoxin component